MRGAFWLRALAEIMNWGDEESEREYDWINLMAQYKYDSYRDYQAGMRFVESLCNWLQQFDSIEERIDAYRFIKNNLIFIGLQEMERIVKQFFHKFVYNKLVADTASHFQIPTYSIHTNNDAMRYLMLLQRKTLFMGLSDGARLDILRRANIGRISNEQVVIATQVDENKWKSLYNDLQNDLTRVGYSHGSNKFCIIYLIDDFMGTGLSFLRKEKIIENGKEEEVWKGKLTKFLQSINHSEIRNFFTENFEICVHHFIGTRRAQIEVSQRYKEYQACNVNNKLNVSFSYSMVLPDSINISESSDDGRKFLELCRKYYNPNIESQHTQVGGGPIIRGFGDCSLPLVLEHNCPNNTVPLIWAEIEKDKSKNFPEMRPLFRRRQRHS